MSVLDLNAQSCLCLQLRLWPFTIYDTHASSLLRRTYQLPITWIINRILLLWHLPVRLHLLVARVRQLDVVVHLGEEGGYGSCEPSLTTELEPAEMAAQVRGAE